MFREIAIIPIFLFLLTPFCVFGADEPLSFEEWKAEKEKRNAENQQVEVKENQAPILFRNDEYRFRINFPAGWEMEDGDGEHVIKKAVNNNGATILVLVRDFTEFLTEADLNSLTEQDKFDIQNAELNNFSDEDIKDFTDKMASSMLTSFPGGKILEKNISYIDNRKAAYLKFNQVYRVQDIQVEGVSINYFTIHKGKMYQVGGFYPKGEDNLEPVIQESLSTFVFEDWGDIASLNDDSSEPVSTNPIKEAINSIYGTNLSNGGIFLLLALSFIFTWIFGLIIPVLLRFVFLKKPISKPVALSIVVVIYIVQLGVAIGLGSEGNHFALILVSFISYKIMRKGLKEKTALKYCKECGNKIHELATICNKCGKKIA